MTSDADMGFGEQLRRSRRAAGLTQEELAARAGLSVRGIADLERGARHTPRRETVALLADALGLVEEDRAAFVAARHLRAPVASMAAGQKSGAVGSPARTGSALGETHQHAPSAVVPHHNLPAQPTRLLGRDDALRTVLALVRRADVRLVTLTGPGGVGKTRLAIEVAAALLGDFTDGVWFVRLSRLSDPGLVVPTIAQTLGLKESGQQPIAEMLSAHLRERRMLVVLDNCEQVAAAAPEVAELLEACPAVKVLATSRMRLRLRAEHEVIVVPLGLPPALTSTSMFLTQYAAVELFAERACVARPDFTLTEANASAVAGICSHVDGLPLAIELAAARLKLLPPAALLARLEGGLGVLGGGARDLDERQQTMRATLAWSEGLLAPEERALFRRLAVFAGGCTLEAAEAVCVVPEEAAPLELDLLDGLSTLVDHSLIEQREEGGEARFGMLHVVREYAMTQLAASGEAEALRRAHLSWLLALVERAEPEMAGPHAEIWLDKLDREPDNLRAALAWTCAGGEAEAGLRLVAAVFRFWVVRGHLREGRAWAERLLALDADRSARAGAAPAEMASATSRAIRARALRAAGVLALYQADETAAGAWLEQAVALGRASGDLQTAALALSSLGIVALHRSDLERARAHLEESLTLLRTVGEPHGITSTLINLGVVTFFQGDLERAAAAETEALASARDLGDRDYMATALANLASVALRQDKVAQAEALGREALALYHDLGDPRRCAVGLEGLAGSAGMAGLGERAARLLGAAAAIREALGTPIATHEQAEVEQTTADTRAALGEERWAAEFALGQDLPLEEAIAEALGTTVQVPAIQG